MGLCFQYLWIINIAEDCAILFHFIYTFLHPPPSLQLSVKLTNNQPLEHELNLDPCNIKSYSTVLHYKLYHFSTSIYLWKITKMRSVHFPAWAYTVVDKS